MNFSGGTQIYEGEDYRNTTDDGCLCRAQVPIRVGLKNRRSCHTRSGRKNPRPFVCSSHDHSVRLERDKRRSSANRCASSRLLPRGGFVAGDLESYDSLLRALANRSQCIVISVAYRLAPENPYPAGNDDAWAALTWVADHASEIGADPQRLAVGGDSAGGLLAAWVAQKAAKNGPKLCLQVLLYPNLDATTSRPSWKELGTGAYLVSHAQMIEWYDAYLPEGINRKAPEVSPLFATDLSGVAPAFIITADHDPLHDEGDEYAAKLKAANVAVDHTCWPGMVHGLASLAGVLDAGKVLIDQIGAALRKAFEPTHGTR
jgi:acetyl esterase